MDESARRFVVKPAGDGRWTFGRAEAVFQIFDSKQAAVSAAERFRREHPEIEFMMEDHPTPSAESTRPTSRARRRRENA